MHNFGSPKSGNAQFFAHFLGQFRSHFFENFGRREKWHFRLEVPSYPSRTFCLKVCLKFAFCLKYGP